MYVWMYVCMSVTVLRLKYTGLWYLWHVPLMMPPPAMAHSMEIEVEDIDWDDARTSPDVWKVNCSTKDERQDKRWRETTCASSTERFTSLADPCTDRRRTARRRRSRFELRHFELSTCSAWGTWCACVYLVNEWAWSKSRVCLLNMVAPRLGFERAVVGTRWATSHPDCMDKLRNTISHSSGAYQNQQHNWLVLSEENRSDKISGDEKRLACHQPWP